MVVTLRVLDLFCGAGGASEGYRQAGHAVHGIDIDPQPRYPFKFWQMDALDLDPSWLGEHYDLIHASPPCQAYSPTISMNKHRSSRDYPRLIGRTRRLLGKTGVPYVIENVPEAPLTDPVTLCGTMFGTACTGRWHDDVVCLRRHRGFELAGLSVPQLSCDHGIGRAVTVCGHGQVGRGHGYGNDPYWAGPGYAALCREVMGIRWMNRKELVEAIPPTYTKYIGSFL
jgi:DNA (cytosine-5)-methyltransferase 1